MTRCPYCGGESIITTVEGEVVCRSCGTVLGYQALNALTGSKEDYENSLQHDDIRLGSRRLRAWVIAAYDGVHRVPYRARIIINALAEDLKLPRAVRDTAFRLFYDAYKTASARRKLRGYRLVALAAYSTLLACKTHNIIRIRWRTIMGALEKRGYAGLRFSHVVSLLEVLELPKDDRQNSSKILDYIKEYVEKVSDKLPPKHKKEYIGKLFASTYKLAEKLPEEALYYSPRTLAATLVYLAESMLAKADRRKKFFTQKDVAELTNSSIYTLREQITRLRKASNEFRFIVDNGGDIHVATMGVDAK